MSHHSNRPLASTGLISYRYANGAYGFVMIGARDDADALNEASRSVSSGPVTFDNLQVWDGKKYVPVSLTH